MALQATTFNGVTYYIPNALGDTGWNGPTGVDGLLIALAGAAVSTSGINSFSGANTFTSTITLSALTASTALVLNSSKQIASSSCTGTELGFVHGVTSAIQTQLNALAPLASPTFTTKILFGNYHVEPVEHDAGNSGTTLTVDLSTGAAQKITLTGSVTLTLSNPQTGGAYMFKIVQGASSYTVTWPVTVKWSGGTAPTITVTNGKIDLINLYWDGTSYYGSFSQNY